MANERVIITDIDGVVLDWEEGFHEWMKQHQNEFDDLADLSQGMYGVHNMYGISKERARLFVNQYNESAAAAFLEPYREAEKYIPLIAEEFDYRFIALTSFGREPYSMHLRKNLLRETCGEVWDDIIILDMGSDKDEALAELKKHYNGCLWVEDKPENALAGAKHGFDSLLISHSHNQDFDFGDHEVRYVKDWKEIYEYVRSQEEVPQRKAM